MTTPSRPRRVGAAGFAVAAALIVPAAACRPGTRPPTTTSPPVDSTTTRATTAPGAQPTVAADGSGRYRTVQAAVDALPGGAVITIAPGTYRGTVRIPATKAGISLRGTTGRATDVVLADGRSAGSAGSNEASSTVVNASAGSTIADVTITNTFDRNTTSSNQDQALALTAKNDRQVYRNVRLLGHQDTFMTVTGSPAVRYRQLFTRCYVEGDVDFIFGNGTTVFDNCEIHSLARSGGTVVAPSTSATNPYGFLFVGSRFTSSSGTATIYLGRPWHPGGDPDADGQTLVRESTLGAHIRTAQPWTDMSGFSWRTEGRFREYRNTGPGAGVNANRPQLTDAQAASYTRERYLGDWSPAS
jgi:pectinesterase